jgi:hypothetical protein
VSGKIKLCIFPSLKAVLILMAFLPWGCRQPRPAREKAMYYWKSSLAPGGYEERFLAGHGIRTLYLKFFDIGLDPSSGRPVPIAPLNARAIQGYNVVPVVFITQNALKAMTDSSAEPYATLICGKIRAMTLQMQWAPVREWQIDCDWTAGTRETYFRLLEKIRKEARAEGIALSVTLRLYPYKYPHDMGVPPADRAMLMCYNMGNLKKAATRNSILDTDELGKYLGAGRPYPLPLDVALPVFSWYVWFRGPAYMGLAYPAEVDALAAREEKDGRYPVRSDTVVNGRAFLKGDWLRREDVSVVALQKARRMLERELAGQRPGRIALFHLDSLTLRNYSSDAIESVLDGGH